MSRGNLDLDLMVDTLKAAAEPSRLRILALLSRGDLTVSDLTSILGQSQPRVSRHLKLLFEASLINRYQEGSWAYFRLAESPIVGDIARSLLERLDCTDALIERDLERLSAVKLQRRERAAAYFSANASSWDAIRSLHVPDGAVEEALLRIVGDKPFQSMLDIGTGTGRLLELFAPLYLRGVGVDINRDMLAIARSNLEKASIGNALVRQGDVYSLPVDRESFDLVTIHQVLHFLDNPSEAIREAARALRPAGRLLIVDFAPHELEFLRDKHAHLRLGFHDDQMRDWLSDAGLSLEKSTELESRGKDKLTVKLWLARDPRLLIADPVSTSRLTESV
ncbi:metalloregulator ArsR/SmtB family transcription factor [Phyllobacterium sp. 21LDTY02-6]|uniref:ArsR/SmtB family transcription factor n=1 Tax=unclassified Phyllobacterium TaxID=2638441 RepID=UPI002020E758|nr:MULTISPECIES: metalloregulator ArsR/SmtB family transcription factor [unclassified Phyllobacterium]MCO4315948.1 metalloregulator ArsR/SmtB family transcription factor [Phyllobacterium sp. 21LDTY02-6]MCX8279628.1 metalloregulator ArsR/SmtB family transcription factor [Phyllobacterium sp. 0TCS1.6C]MCX8292181.1 metalloregulator ArsR/SmtB family transcription factor [Phyllobacterium sp. 0TCS1.6A]